MASSKEHWSSMDKIQKTAATVVGFAAVIGIGNSVYQHFATDSELAIVAQSVANATIEHNQEKACDNILRYQREIDRLEIAIDEGFEKASAESAAIRNITRNEMAQERLRPKAAEDCEPPPQ
jgi:hypothetical protein